jgi:hypothetical protein
MITATKTVEIGEFCDAKQKTHFAGTAGNLILN